MNVSKRTWILIAVAVIGVLAALASLYFEKEAVINELVNVPGETETARRPRKSTLKVEKEETKPESNLIPDGNEAATE